MRKSSVVQHQEPRKDERPIEKRAEEIVNLIREEDYPSARIKLTLEKRKNGGVLHEELAELKMIVDSEIVLKAVRTIREHLDHRMTNEAYSEWVKTAIAYPTEDEENRKRVKPNNTPIPRERIPRELKPLRDEIATLLEESASNNERGNGVALRRDYNDSMFED